MKTIKILILVLFASLSSYAQDPQLFENTWYLQNVIIDGQDNLPPSNNEVPHVGLDFSLSTPQFITYVCNSAEGEVNYDLVNPTFNFIDDLSITLILCNDNTNQFFENLYFNFYLNDILETFSYSIISNVDTKTLIITSSSGDEAIYSSELLSTQNFSTDLFTIYPNPIKDELFISSKFALNDFNIFIYNIDGKLILSLNDSELNNNSIDVQKLNSGIYFILLKDREGRSLMKKLIKY